MARAYSISHHKVKMVTTTANSIEVLIRATSTLVAIVDSFSDFLTSNPNPALQDTPLETGTTSTKQMIKSEVNENIVNRIIKSENENVFYLTPKLETETTGSTTLAECATQTCQPSWLPPSEEATPNYLTSAGNVHELHPFARFVNLILIGLKPGRGRTGTAATLLLENPIGCNILSFDSLVQNVQSVFELRGVNICLFFDSQLTLQLDGGTHVDSLFEETIYVGPKFLKGSVPCVKREAVSGPICHYVNFDIGDKVGTFLLENPKGDFLSWTEFLHQASTIMSVPLQQLEFVRSKNIPALLDRISDEDLGTLNGKTIFGTGLR